VINLTPELREEVRLTSRIARFIIGDLGSAFISHPILNSVVMADHAVGDGCVLVRDEHIQLTDLEMGIIDRNLDRLFLSESERYGCTVVTDEVELP